MLAQLNVSKRHASSELGSVIDEGIQSTQKHLDHAKQLAKSLEGEAKRQ